MRKFHHIISLYFNLFMRTIKFSIPMVQKFMNESFFLLFILSLSSFFPKGKFSIFLFPIEKQKMKISIHNIDFSFLGEIKPKKIARGGEKNFFTGSEKFSFINASPYHHQLSYSRSLFWQNSNHKNYSGQLSFIYASCE